MIMAGRNRSSGEQRTVAVQLRVHHKSYKGCGGERPATNCLSRDVDFLPAEIKIPENIKFHKNISITSTPAILPSQRCAEWLL